HFAAQCGRQQWKKDARRPPMEEPIHKVTVMHESGACPKTSLWSEEVEQEELIEGSCVTLPGDPSSVGPVMLGEEGRMVMEERVDDTLATVLKGLLDTPGEVEEEGLELSLGNVSCVRSQDVE
ncbi:hypothetical protein OTU49_001744, partial [Cherax quadricarinatus]